MYCMCSSPGEFALAECSAYSNTQCKLCTSCTYGNYISSPCVADTDTQCDRCHTCSEMEWEETECTAGVNTKCRSCEECFFVLKDAQRQCESSVQYQRWKRLNCCKSSKGEVTPCSEVDLANIKISAERAHIPVSFQTEL